MLKKSVSGMSAQKLRIILLVSILLLLVIGTVGFLYVRGVISTYAQDVAKADAVARSSDKNVQVLKKLKSDLADNQDSVMRTKELVAESQSYAYQDQIIRDINLYAGRSQIAVAGYAFNNDSATGSSGAAPASGAQTPAATSTPAPTGIKTVSVTVNLKSPMKYENLMTFIHYIEQNLTKMQLAGVSVSKDPASGNVTASTLTLEVYVR